MSLSLCRRRLASALAAALFGVGLPALAATPTAEFAMSPAQMQALGVGLRRLDAPAAVAGLAAPARVVLPPQLDMLVSAPVDGVVERLFVNPQDPVKAGQPLLRLASPAYGELQLRGMEAGARARLARQTLERERQLFAEGIIPERRVQEAQAALQGADAALRQAEAALRLAGADAAGLGRIAAGGRLDDGLVVRARSGGWVASLDVRLGQRVREADTLARIADPREVWLEAQVPAGASVQPGQAVPVVGRDATAVAQSLGTLVGEGQTLTLRARVTRGAERLRPGEVVQVQVPPAPSGGWALPLRALTHHEGRAYVFVRSARGFVATPVSVVASAGTQAQVQGAPGGLSAGQEVAVAAVAALKSAWLGLGGGE
ncbi:efflux RND transporter periplasmic adaptor subunit [Roseateles sp.]|uniref:efflux RND transporter periplasmic adaptor subunit n=1 Tax=Roseateles sp. TaxID=1971397 RepID=UPI0025DF1D36|nr:efflux RND transporter periplasmic adaptor subunit [Roseateles sp.]MBV8036190.1 efflux RND transporter periplasmic adaptor subunit [Roseateles sp.]